MKRSHPCRILFPAATLAAGALVAWQSSGLALLGLDDASARAGTQKVLTQRLGMESLDGYAGVPAASAARKAFISLSPDQRTAATQALGQLVKTLVLSAPFRAAWEAEVKIRGGADHGLDLNSPAMQPPTDPNQAMDAVKKSILGSRVTDAQQFAKNKQMPAAALKIIIDLDQSMISPADTMMVASQAARKAALAKYAEAAKLLDADPAAAQKAILDAKLLAAGLPTGSAGVDQATSKVNQQEDAAEKRRQQELWNKLLLAPLVRKQLERFIEVAGTVDFAAATQPKDKKLVFVNPAYERKSHDWKLLYRAGKGPTMAAVAFARQILAELK